MSEIIDKLVYQVKMLGQTIDSMNYPLEALVLSMNWSRAELEDVFKFFEKWEINRLNGVPINNGDFETEFVKNFNSSYQKLKSIILAFWRNGQWKQLCEAYVDSFGQSAPIEYSEIVNR